MEPLVERDNDETVETVTTRRRPARSKGMVIALSFLLILGALILIGAIPRMVRQERLVESKQTELKEPPHVVAVAAAAGNAVQEFVLPGTTQAIQDAPIYARVDGYLKKRYVNIGDNVRAGQVLADIDTPEIDQQVQAAKSDVEQAKANVETAQQSFHKAQADALTAHANVIKGGTDLDFATTQVSRYTGLAQQGAVSMEDRDARRQQYNAAIAVLDSLRQAEKSAQANVNSAKAAVNVARAGLDTTRAKLNQLEATRSFKRVVAPFDGVVVKRNVDAGALISSGSDSNNALLFQIAKTNILRVFVYVPEQYVSFIHPDEKVFLKFQSYPQKEFEGAVKNIAGGLDPESKTLQVEIHVQNEDKKLMPGMYARARFEAPSQYRAAVIPATTLQVRPDGGFVYVIGPDNRVHMHKITIGRDLGGQFEVTSGINVGDMLVMNPSDQIGEGVLVTPQVAKAQEAKATK